MFGVPLSPHPFVPDHKEQSFSCRQSQAHPPLTQGDVLDDNFCVEEDDEEEEEEEEEQYVVIRNGTSKGKGVASSISSTQSTNSRPASSSLSSRICGGQPGTRPHHRPSSLSSPIQSISRSTARSKSSSSSSFLSRQASAGQPLVLPASYPSDSSPAPTRRPTNRPSFSSPPSVRQPTGRPLARPVSLSRTNGECRGASQVPPTHVANQGPRAAPTQTAQLRGYTDAHAEPHRAVNIRLHDAARRRSRI
ncbi:hypothetical protein BG000_005879, partial [Podila horticola]